MRLITIDQLDMAMPMARYADLVNYVGSLNGWNGKEDRPEIWAEARAVMLA